MRSMDFRDPRIQVTVWLIVGTIFTFLLGTLFVELHNTGRGWVSLVLCAVALAGASFNILRHVWKA